MNIKDSNKIIVVICLCWFGLTTNAVAQSAVPADTSKEDTSFLDNLNFDNAAIPETTKKAEPVKAIEEPKATPAARITPTTEPAVEPAAIKEEEPVNAATADTAKQTPPVPNDIPQPVEGTPSTAKPVVPGDNSSNVTPITPTPGGVTANDGSEEPTAEAPAKRSRMRTFVGGSKFNRFSLGLNVGVAKIGNVISDNAFLKNNIVPGFELVGSYWLGRAVAVQGRFGLPGSFTGNTLVNGAALSYETKSQFDYSLDVLFNLGNISFLSKKPNLAFYSYIGIGAIRYNATTTDALGNKNEGSTRFDNILPIGMGVKYKVNEQLTASSGYTVKFVRSDMLDNVAYLGNDNYSSYNVGVSYTFGKPSKPSLEWSNAAALLFEDINNSDKVVQLRKKLSALQNQVDSINTNVIAKLDSLTGDIDGDGVPNLLDKQNDTPKGAMVDASGRALDSDGDGVIDLYDKCPFEKGLAMYEGCKKAPSSGAKGITAPLANTTTSTSKFKPTYKSGEEDDFLKEINDQLLFDKNTFTLRPAAQIALDRLANEMKDNNKKMLLSGYTDNDGSEDLNKKLSLQRAIVVKQYLVKNGDIKGKRLITRGLGSSTPIVNGQTSKDKQRNRAVMITYTE